MDPETQFWVAVWLGAAAGGAFCGFLPLILALGKNRHGLAVVSWMSCIVAGLIFGLLLAVPVMLVFTIFIWFLKNPEELPENKPGPP